MAIKKGAFELYTQERTLPEKHQNKTIKSSHFFDDSYKVKIGSQSVHNRSAENDTLDFATSNHKEIQKNESLNKKNWQVKQGHARINEANNGSQKVHNQFTANEINLPKKIMVDETISANTSKSGFSFSRLVGNQREIIISLYKNMRVNKTDVTEELTLEMIANLASVNQKSLKNTLFRLTKAGFLSRVEQKNGRGGWVKYKINNQIIRELEQKNFFVALKPKNGV